MMYNLSIVGLIANHFVTMNISTYLHGITCGGWIMFELQRKRNPSVLSSSEKALEIPESEMDILLLI